MTEQCAICLQGMTKFLVLECGHKFHSDCIMNWFLPGQNTCPMCRQKSYTSVANRTPWSTILLKWLMYMITAVHLYNAIVLLYTIFIQSWKQGVRSSIEAFLARPEPQSLFGLIGWEVTPSVIWHLVHSLLQLHRLYLLTTAMTRDKRITTFLVLLECYQAMNS